MAELSSTYSILGEVFELVLLGHTCPAELPGTYSKLGVVLESFLLSFTCFDELDLESLCAYLFVLCWLGEAE